MRVSWVRIPVHVFVGAWLSLVEHSVRDRGVEGSNPFAPTNSSFSSENPQNLAWRVTRFLPPLRGSRTECPVLQIPSTVKILRDFSLPSLATGPSHGLWEAKRYPPRYPDNRDPARFAI